MKAFFAQELCKYLSLSKLHLVFTTEFLMQLEDTKQFRQLHSKTPGHPENFITDGVEVTTGSSPRPCNYGISILCNSADQVILMSRDVDFRASLTQECLPGKSWEATRALCLQVMQACRPCQSWL